MPRFPGRMPFLFALSGWLSAAAPAIAHEDTFLWSYPYMTPDQGERELELRTNAGYSSGYQKHEIELEYGLSDHFSLAPYLVFARDNGGGSLQPDALKLEARGRLFEAGQLPLDVGGYLEYEQTLAAADPKALEAKLILERDFGPLTLGTNGIATQLFGASTETLYGMTAGLGYALTPEWNLNLELISGRAATDITPDPADLRASGTYVGPTLAGYFGPAHLNIGAALGVTPGSDPVFVRTQLSTEF